MPDYAPLSRRLSGEDQVLHRGVPAHLQPPLIEWIKEYETQEILHDAALRAEVWYAPTQPQFDSHRIPALLRGLELRGLEAGGDQSKAFLDVVDGILFLRSHEAEGITWERGREEAKAVAKECAQALEKIFRLGGSHWRVVGDHLYGPRDAPTPFGGRVDSP